LNIRPMTLDDIKYLVLPEEWMRERYIPYIEAQTGPAWILEDEGEKLCAFGASLMWSGVYEVWFNLIKKKRLLRQALTVKSYLKNEWKKYKVHRVFAMVRCDFEIGRRFVEALGFHCETPDGMKQYNPDKSDAYLYARIV